VSDTIHSSADELSRCAQAPSQSDTVGLAAVKDQIALSIQALESVCNMCLYIGKPLRWRLQQLDHPAMRSAITMSPKVQGVAAGNCLCNDPGSIPILAARL